MQPADVAAQNRNQMANMESLKLSIQHLHRAIEDMPNAEQKSKAAAALNTLTTIQAEAHRPYIGPNRSTD